jgi:hypothetical protein
LGYQRVIPFFRLFFSFFNSKQVTFFHIEGVKDRGFSFQRTPSTMSSSKATKMTFNNNSNGDEDEGSIASSSSSSTSEEAEGKNEDHSKTDSASQHGGAEGGGSSDGGNKRHSSLYRSILSQGVTRAVLCSKLTVYLVLLITAIVAGSVTYVLTRQQEQKNMESEVSCNQHNIYSLSVPSSDQFCFAHTYVLAFFLSL